MLRKGDAPLKECVLRSPGHTTHLRCQLANSRPTAYKKWKQGHLSKAVGEIQNGSLSVRRAALEYDIPKSTLHDHLTGRVVCGGLSGPRKYLTDEEEDELEEFLVGCASVGFAKWRAQVLELVQEVVRRKGIDVRVTHGWWDAFRRRHPNITLRTAAQLSYARVVGSNPTIIMKYFDLLEQTLTDNELLDKSSQIFNLDETGMPLNPSQPRVVVGRGSKHPSAPASGDKSHITVLACCSATGYAIPPFVIFDRLSLKPELSKGEVPGTIP